MSTLIMLCLKSGNILLWLSDLDRIDRYLADELHLKLHPDKKYLQHYSKGIDYIGYRLRFDRILPSKRIVHNFSWKVERMIKMAESDPTYMYKAAEHFMQTINSYLGFLKWCNAYRLKEQIINRVKESCWSTVFDLHEDFHVTLKPYHTAKAYYARENKRQKKLRSAFIF